MRVKDKLRLLYEGDTPEAHHFRYALLVFDLATILFIVATSFLTRSPAFEWMDVIIGLVILADFSARLLISRTRWRDLLRPATLADMVAIGSFLAPAVGEQVRLPAHLAHPAPPADLSADRAASGRLSVLPALRGPDHRIGEPRRVRLRHDRLRLRDAALDEYEDRNYIDALYFTVTALTTTGFGDITLTGTRGRLISVIIMICGVTLFLRLVRVLLRPHKVRFPCPPADCSGMTGMRSTARPAAPPSTFPTKARSDDHASGMMATPRSGDRVTATAVPGRYGSLRPWSTTKSVPTGVSTSYSTWVPR